MNRPSLTRITVVFAATFYLTVLVGWIFALSRWAVALVMAAHR